MDSLDYAVMNKIGGNGFLKDKALQRLGSSDYDLSNVSPYNVFFVINTLRQNGDTSRRGIVKELHIGPEKFDETGRWNSMLPQGWPKEDIHFYSQESTTLNGSFTEFDVTRGREIIKRYLEKDRDQKKIAIVGPYNQNVTDPRVISYTLDRDLIKEGRLTAHRGDRNKTTIVAGTRLLPSNAPDLTIEDFAELPAKMAREAQLYFQRICEGLFIPNLVLDEFKAA